MIVGNDEHADALIKAHFETWLNHVGEGLDLWLITDEDDYRTLEDIIPVTRNDKVNYFLYRSKSKKDGRRIRFKVIDSFRKINDIYVTDKTKMFFYKMDTDTYVIPENLLSYADKLNKEAQNLPMHVGRLMCIHKDICHATGGLQV